jgi:hypothetical protein
VQILQDQQLRRDLPQRQQHGDDRGMQSCDLVLARLGCQQRRAGQQLGQLWE